MANSADPDQTAPIGAVFSGSTLFASILNSSVMLGNICSRRLQQTTFSDAFFSWHFKGGVLLFCPLLIFFRNQLFSKNSFRNTIIVSISLDPDLARRDLGSN